MEKNEIVINGAHHILVADEGKPAFVVRKRKFNNVILVTRNKKEALNLTSRLNQAIVKKKLNYQKQDNS